MEKKPFHDFDIADFKETPPPLPGIEHTSTEEHESDLTSFDEQISEYQQTNESFEQFLNTIEQNNTPENITMLRQGGVLPEDNEQYDQAKHVRLAASFTKWQQIKINGESKKAYAIDFGTRKVAENHVGLGDIFPPHVETVSVYDKNGNLVSAKAVRRINSKNRIGYYDYETGRYIAVRNGYTAVIGGTRSNNPAKDPILARRKQQEKTALYEYPTRQDTRNESLQESLKTPPSAPQPNSEGIPIETPPKNPEPTGIPLHKNEEKVITASRKEVKLMGFKPITKVTPSVRRKADEILLRGQPIGSVTIVEIDGKKWAFRDEVHKHKATDNVPDSLKKNHHGITVIGVA